MARKVCSIVVIVCVLGGLFVLLRPDNSASGPRGRTFDVSIAEGEMDPEEISAYEGDRVTLGVESDEPLELHVHGYDLGRKVEPGRRTELSFVADLTGRFEIENHETEQELGEFQVHPR